MKIFIISLDQRYKINCVCQCRVQLGLGGNPVEGRSHGGGFNVGEY